MLLRIIYFSVFSFIVSTTRADEYIVRFKKTEDRSRHVRILREQNIDILDQIDVLDMFFIDLPAGHRSIDFLKNSDSVLYVEKNKLVYLTISIWSSNSCTRLCLASPVRPK